MSCGTFFEIATNLGLRKHPLQKPTHCSLTVMKKNLVSSIFVPVLLLSALPGEIRAQEFFRDLGTSRSSSGFGPVTPSEFSYEDASPSGLSPLRPGQELNEAEAAEEANRYNFAIGPVQFGLALGIGLEYNDNITLSDDNELEDFILRPILDVQAVWYLSELNTIKLSLGASYAKYFEHTQYDSRSVLLSPNSELAFTFFLGQVMFTVRDRFSYQEDTYDTPLLDNIVSPYRRFENQIGIEMDWAINDKVNLAVGFDHYNLWVIGDDYPLQPRAIETVFVKPSYNLAPGLKLGLNVSYSYIDFTSNDRPDGFGVLAGPFIQWQISEYTNLYLEGGYQALEFEQLGLSQEESNAVDGVLFNDQNSNSYYIKFEINNKPSDIFDHRLSFSRTTELAFYSNYYELYHVEYDANWKVFQHAEIGPVLFYEYYTTSGDLGESAQRVGAALGMRYHFSNSITLGLDYRFIAQDSDVPNNDYKQNVAFLSLYYKF